MDCHKIIENITQGNILSEKTIKQLCRKFTEVLSSESNLVAIEGPVNIIGDVHGQFYDVQKIFKEGGDLPHNKYLFLGDYVDRGYQSLETIILLACYKILYPQHLFLLRGNHQSRQVSSVYGFYQETNKKYGSTTVWKLFNQSFDYLPLTAIVNQQIFCVHGGLSPDLHTTEQINDIDRIAQIPSSGLFGDLVWSDPQEIQNWGMSSRGVGWLFGYRVVNEFNEHNWLKLIVRSHQLVERGYQQWFKQKNLVTIWSAPNYCYRCGNLGIIMQVQQDSTVHYRSFNQDQRSAQSLHYSKLIPYFL